MIKVDDKLSQETLEKVTRAIIIKTFQENFYICKLEDPNIPCAQKDLKTLIKNILEITGKEVESTGNFYHPLAVLKANILEYLTYIIDTVLHECEAEFDLEKMIEDCIPE